MATEIACPFVYANGRRCSGHTTHVEAYKCDVSWTPDADGKWRPSVNEARSHYHLFCSEKGNHTGSFRSDNTQMKCHRNELPDGLELVG